VIIGVISGAVFAWAILLLFSPSYTARARVSMVGTADADAFCKESIQNLNGWVLPIFTSLQHHGPVNLSIRRSKEKEVELVFTTTDRELSLLAAKEVFRRMSEARPDLVVLEAPECGTFPNTSFGVMGIGALVGLASGALMAFRLPQLEESVP
jgi:hypothetical protein